MLKVCIRIVPRLPNDDQKECHMQVYRDTIELLKKNQNYFLKSSLVMRHGFLSTNRKPSDIAEAEDKVKSQVVLITFFDVRGIVHSQLMSQG